MVVLKTLQIFINQKKMTNPTNRIAADNAAVYEIPLIDPVLHAGKLRIPDRCRTLP